MKIVKKIVVMTKMEFFVFWREPVAIFFIVLFPLIITGGTYITNGKNGITEIIPINIGMCILAAALLGVTMNLAIYRENHVLKKFQTTGVAPELILIAEFNVLFGLSVLSILIELLVSKLLGLDFDIYIYYFIIDIVIGSIYFFSIGFLISAIIKNVKSIHAVTSFLFCIMMFLGFNTTNNKFSMVINKLKIISPLNQLKYLLESDIFGKICNIRIYIYMYILLSIIIFMLIGRKKFKWG